MTRPNLVVKSSAVVLMALMAATRFHHFGTPFALPDASLAVFFFAGLWLGGRGVFALLVLEAVVIDYLAIHDLGVNDFCMSPAYIFLLPAYAAMWQGGLWCRRFQLGSINAMVQQIAILLAVTTLAFVISNTSFYLVSSKVVSPSWAQYLDTFMTYYPAYLSATLIYGVMVSGCSAVVVLLRSKFKPAVVSSGV